jgi:hypothetical protein
LTPACPQIVPRGDRDRAWIPRLKPRYDEPLLNFAFNFKVRRYNKVSRVVRIPAEEAVLLNSREKAPYLLCLEVISAAGAGRD